jgi:hypothetical protein
LVEGKFLSSSDNPQFEIRPPVNAEPQAMFPAPPDAVELPPVASTGGALIATAVPPPENPVWSGWDVSLIAALTLLTLFVVESAIVLGAWLFVYPGSRFDDVAQRPLLSMLGQYLAYLAVVAYMVMLVQGKYHSPFWVSIRWRWPGKASLRFLGIGVLTVALDILSRFLPMPKTSPFDQFFARPIDAYLMVTFAVGFGPLMEELFFRGFLYPVLARRIAAPAAVLLTALPFGLLHYVQYRSWAAVLIITLVGVVLGSVRAVTKSVAASFLVHVGYNGTLMTLAAVATDGFRHMDKAALGPFLLR